MVINSPLAYVSTSRGRYEYIHFSPVKAGWVSRPEEEPQTNANSAYVGVARFP